MKRLVIALMIAAGAFPLLLCAAQPVKVTGIYSNMALHQESGDVLGIELFVIISSSRCRRTVHTLEDSQEHSRMTELQGASRAADLDPGEKRSFG